MEHLPGRRDFLRLAVVLGGGAALSNRAAWGEGEARSALTLGFTLYGARGENLEQFLPKLKSVGFESVELCVAPGWGYEPPLCTPERCRKLRALLDKTGLKLTCLMEHVGLDGDATAQKNVCQRLARAAEMGHVLAPRTPPIVESTMGGKAQTWEQVQTRFRDALGGWATVAGQSKTVLAVKPHRFQAVNRP